MYHSRTTPQLPKPAPDPDSSAPLRQIEIPCRYHSGSVCLNYCNEGSCFKLLCEQCIEDHLEFHRKNGLGVNSIKSFKKVREIGVEKINRLVEELMGKLAGLKPPKNPQQILQQANQKFQAIKKIMFQTIEQQLSRFYQQLKSKLSQSLTTITSLQQIHQNLNKIIQQLKQSKSIIVEGSKQIPQTLEKVLIMNQNIYIDTFTREANGYAQKLSYVEFDVNINQNKFRSSVCECLRIVRSQYEEGGSGSSEWGRSRVQMQKGYGSNMHTMNTNPYSQPQSRQISRQKKPQPPTSPSSLTIPIKLTSPVKLLHFFEPSSPYLHTIAIPSMKRQRITLSNFIVPFFHCSVLTSQEYIFISGGLIDGQGDGQGDGDGLERKSNKMSKYSLRGKGSDGFKKDFCTVRPRSSHTLCQYGDYVYILGGYGLEVKNKETELEKNVEKVNIRTGKVQLQTRSKYGGANLAVIINDSILKASQQGVQLYNILSKKWTLITTPQSFTYLRCSGYSKLTKQSLLVYGGYNDNEQGIDTCQHWTLPQGGTELRLKRITSRLPYREGFLNNPGVVADGTLYALQNTVIEGDQECSQSCIADGERVLVVFDGVGWKEVEMQM